MVENSLNYEENGVLPYSAYFYKDILEEEFKTALLGLHFGLIVL